MKLYGSNTFQGQPFGNCLQPTVGTEFVTVFDRGLAYSYSKPIITAIAPKHGRNMQNASFEITIFGTNFGGSARDVLRAKCLLPAFAKVRACQQLFLNTVLLYNQSCQRPDLLYKSSTPAEIEQEIEERTVAACTDNNVSAITFKCHHAFQPEKYDEFGAIFGSPKYSTCLERCRFKFRNCGRKCAEDFIRCEVLPVGGVMTLTVVLGGQPSNPWNLTYDQPRVWYIIPPELEAVRLLPGQIKPPPSLLTIIGENFGIDLPLAYAGRVQSEPIGPYTWAYPNKKFDSKQIPDKYTGSLDWWDFAQYRTCFSTFDPQRMSLKPYVDDENIEINALASMSRTCDEGLVVSEMISLNDISLDTKEATGSRYMQVVPACLPIFACACGLLELNVAIALSLHMLL
jgi:hypothetical protein